MWGAVIGDLAGSKYEFSQSKKISRVDVTKIIEEDSFFSDDTILTIANYDAIFHECQYEKYLRLYGTKYLNYIPKTTVKKRFKRPFSHGFENWLQRNAEGTSAGNGALMRISGVGFMFDNKTDVIKNAYLATKPSHFSKEAINSATDIALIIYYARLGMGKDDIMERLKIKSLVYKPFETFNKTCSETEPNCLYALFTSNSFEEAIIRVLSMGGDTDTNAAVVGAMAESLYGVPQYLVDEARAKIPEEFSKILDKAYESKKKATEKS